MWLRVCLSASMSHIGTVPLPQRGARPTFDTLNLSPRMVTRPKPSQFSNAFEAELSHGLLEIERHSPQRNQIRQPHWKAMLQVSKCDSCRPTAHLNENNCWIILLNTNDGWVWRGPKKMFQTDDLLNNQQHWPR